MPRTRRWIALGLATLVLASASLAQTQAKPKRPRQTKKPSPKPLVLPPLPNGPLPQLPMDLLPAAPPKVGFQGGMLTIVAQNSTLSDILRDVHKLTGASIDIPPNTTERVVTRLGPGAPRDVIASLLNGSTFNYVMVGSPTDPAAVTSVVLTPKPAGTPSPTVANASQPNQGSMRPTPQPYPVQQMPPQAAVVQPGPGADDNATADEADASADENADQDQGQPDASGNAQSDQQQQPQPGPPNAGPKTPEQILEMLRRQQQQPPTAVPPNPQQPPEN